MAEPVEIVHEDCDLYVVWSKAGHKPWVTFNTEAEALASAQRLAALYNDRRKFIVLKGYAKFHARPAPEAVATEVEAADA